MNGALGWRRLGAMVRKEFIQVRRDRLTFALMFAMPIVQLIVFGYAINADPKNLPIAVVSAENSVMSRSLVRAIENSGYFRVAAGPATVADAEHRLLMGEVQFVLEIPGDFTRRLVRGEQPALRLAADASDPAATSNALAAVQQLAQTALRHDLKGALAARAPPQPAFDLRLQRLYNPEGITQYNIVPGLMGVILTMTMIVMTALGITREIERGTMENLLAMPIRPIEVMIGKILPFVLVGYVQVFVVLLSAHYLFSVPIVGGLGLLLVCTLVFIIANLIIGITFSTVAKNQTQAMQMGLFFLLPSILLSGFMFPYRGMPLWAQWLGEALPLTHFLRIVRGIVLKGYGTPEVWPHLWPQLLFIAILLTLGVRRFRRTLD